MMDGLSAAASALAAQGRRMDALANDTANVSTAGYRSRRTGFSDMPAPARGVVARDLGIDTRQGSLIETGEPLDLAIEGDAWFQVTGPGGRPALMRAGNFQVDAAGQLVTASGRRLVPPVILPGEGGSSAVQVAADGTVTVAGARVGQITLVTVPAPSALEPLGDGLYAPNASSGGTRVATGAAVRQGYQEASNVDLADTAVGTIETRTAFGAAARSLAAQDEMLAALLDLRRGR